MQTVDLSGTIVIYNLVIGVLIMLASEKLASIAGHFNGSHRERIARLARVSTFTLGACVATLSATIYLLFHLLRVGV